LGPFDEIGILVTNDFATIVAKYLPAADSVGKRRCHRRETLDATLTIAGRKRGPVVTLALEKPLFRNVPQKHLW
jgi:hypothetical protein